MRNLFELGWRENALRILVYDLIELFGRCI